MAEEVETMLYISKIISFVLALIVWFVAACSESIGQAVILTIIGVVLIILSMALELLDQADWNEKTKYCTKNNRRVCGNRQRRKKEV